MMQTNFVIPQNADWNETIYFFDDDGTPINITGYTFASQFKISYQTSNISGNLIFTTIDAANGVLSVGYPASLSANNNAQKYVFDILMHDTFGVATRIVQGLLHIVPAVTDEE